MAAACATGARGGTGRRGAAAGTTGLGAIGLAARAGPALGAAWATPRRLRMSFLAAGWSVVASPAGRVMREVAAG